MVQRRVDILGNLPRLLQPIFNIAIDPEEAILLVVPKDATTGIPTGGAPREVPIRVLVTQRDEPYDESASTKYICEVKIMGGSLPEDVRPERLDQVRLNRTHMAGTDDYIIDSVEKADVVQALWTCTCSRTG